MRSLGGSMTRGRQLGNRKPGDSGPAIQYLRPVSNVNTLWGANAYTLIDDVVVQPTAPSDGDNAFANKNDDNEEQIWGMALGDAGSYSSLRLWVNCKTNDSVSHSAQARLNLNGSWTDQEALTVPTTFAWVSVDFAGPVTLPLSTHQLGIEVGAIAFGDDVLVVAAYVEAVP